MEENLITENDVRKVVVQRLNYYQSVGVVLNWERINCGRVQSFGKWFYGAKAGFPDYFAEVIKNKIIFICYFETKKPNDGNWSDEQIIFKSRHEKLLNCSYDLVTDPNQVDKRIETITNYTENMLNEITDHLTKGLI